MRRGPPHAGAAAARSACSPDAAGGRLAYAAPLPLAPTISRRRAGRRQPRRSPSTRPATRSRSGRATDGAHTIVQAASQAGRRRLVPRSDLSVGRAATRPNRRSRIDAAGNAVALWSRYNGSKYVVQSADPAGRGRLVSAPVDLSARRMRPRKPPGSRSTPPATRSRSGRATTGLHYIVQAASRPAGGAWRAPLDLSVAGPRCRRTAGRARRGGQRGRRLVPLRRHRLHRSRAPAARRRSLGVRRSTSR